MYIQQYTERFLYSGVAEVTDAKPVVGGHADTVGVVGYQASERQIVGPGTS